MSNWFTGMDLSTLLAVEKNGGRFYDKGQQGDAMEILRGYGMNLVRLRLWNDPFDEKGNPYSAGDCDIETVLALAKRAKRLGVGWLLDFHYSDFWADPGKQRVPKAWRGMNAKELEQAVYDYTALILERCREEDVVPQMVAVGNELSNGLLWPLGQLPPGGSWRRFRKNPDREVPGGEKPAWTGEAVNLPEVYADDEAEVSPDGVSLYGAYKNVTAFVSAGIRAVRDFERGKNTGSGTGHSVSDSDLQAGEENPDDEGNADFCKIPVMIHLDNGGNNELYRRWFDQYFANGGADFEYIGLSYYPFWHGSLAMLQSNMNDIALRYGKKLMVAEVSMGFTMEDYASYEKLQPNERKGMATRPELAAAIPYPMSPQGQADFIRDLIRTIRNVPDELGCGFIYWEPAWLPVPNVGWANEASCAYIQESGPYGNEWANQALFDYDGNALPALEEIASSMYF